jgi:hypothetical protein
MIGTRVTLIIGLTNGTDIDCPVESREEADKVIESIRSGGNMVRLSRASFAKRQTMSEIGSRAVTYVNPSCVAYCQVLGAEE